MSVPGRIGRLLRAFRRDRQAAAAVEFALILPLLVLIVLGGAGASSYLSAVGRAEQAARTLGDLFSGTAPTLRNVTALDYLGWGREVARVGRNDRYLQGVTSYGLNPTGPPYFIWRKGDGGLPHTVPDLEAFRQRVSTVYVVVVTVRYVHNGPVNLPPFSDITIDRTLAFVSRYGRISLTN